MRILSVHLYLLEDPSLLLLYTIFSHLHELINNIFMAKLNFGLASMWDGGGLNQQESWKQWC